MTDMIIIMNKGHPFDFFFIYYTLYPDAAGNLVRHEDIYGFDGIIYENIKKFL